MQIASRPGCGSAQLYVGEQIEPIISVHNTSGYDWKSTWVFIEGSGSYLKLEPGHGFGGSLVPSIAMDNHPADMAFASASFYNMGPLPAGEVGDIHIYMTAEEAGEPEVLFAVWGNTESHPTPSVPSKPNGIACKYLIGSY
jgi:hypothetical protein